MTKKRKRYPDLNQKLERPWCYYCERDFDDLKILISHQKAKHFKCDRCGRRLNTAGGLSVHMTQVHKENLTFVENANPGRQGLEIEIFGMEGVPADIIDQHTAQVTQAHFAEEAERARITGNPVRGAMTNGANGEVVKRTRVVEDLEVLEQRADQYREDRRNGVLPVKEVVVEPTPPTIQPPVYAPPAFQSHTPTNGFSRPPDAVDDLIAGVLREAPAAAATAEKKEKSKKDKNMRLIYNDENVSPEEKMAALPRFAEWVRT